MTPVAELLHPCALEQHEAAVRRVVRAILLECDDVDDVVQETWLRFLRRPPVDFDKSVAYIAGIARRVAAERRRERSRRGARERSRPIDDALDLPGLRSLQQEDARTLLADGLRAIRNPHRSVVLMHYFDGASVRQIGAALGVSPAQAHKLLAQGREQLRQWFDQNVGSRRHWSLLLLPLCVDPPAVTAAPPLVPARWGLAAAAVVLCAFAAYEATWPIANAAPPARSTGELTRVPVSELGHPGPPKQLVAPVEVAPVPHGVRVTGRLLGVAGRPLAGAAVCLLGYLPERGAVAPNPWRADPPPGPLDQRRTTTGSDGGFAFDGVWPRSTLALAVTPGGPHRNLVPIEVTPGPDDEFDLGDVRLVERVAVTGRVVDADGSPVSGVRIHSVDVANASLLPLEQLDPEMVVVFAGRVLTTPPWARDLLRVLRGPRVVSDEAGAFSLPGLSPGRNLVVLHALDGRRWFVARSTGAGREWRITAPARHRGHIIVRAPEGTPVVHGEVAAGRASFAPLPDLLPRVGWTDEGGSVAYDCGSGRSEIVCAVRTVDHPFWQVMRAPSDDEIVIRLPRRQRLEVHLGRVDGRPAAGARVLVAPGRTQGELLALGLNPTLAAQQDVNRPGVFAADVAPGPYTVLATADACGVFARVVEVSDRGCAVDATLSPLTTGSVRVVDSRGKPVEGAQVYVHENPRPVWLRSVLDLSDVAPRWSTLPRKIGCTSDDGVAALTYCVAGKASLVVTHPAFAPATLELDLPGRATVTLHDLVRVEGRLLQDGSTLADGLVELAIENPRTGLPRDFIRTLSGAQGQLSFGALPPGSYDIGLRKRVPPDARSLGALVELFRRSDWRSRPRTRMRVSPGALSYQTMDVAARYAVEENGRMTITGHVLVDGKPPAGARIALHAHQPFSYMRQRDGAEHPLDGPSFRFPNVPRRHDYLLRLERDDGVLWSRELGPALEPALRVEVDLRTSPVRGKLVDDAGQPLPLVDFELTGTLAGFTGRADLASLRVRTDDRGAFDLRVAPGEYRACLGAQRTAVITVPRSGVEVDLRLDRRTQRFDAAVRDR